MENKVQTRDIGGGLEYFKTVSEAKKFAEGNLEVWKISFTFNGERVRLVRDKDNTWELTIMEEVVKKLVEEINDKTKNDSMEPR